MNRFALASFLAIAAASTSVAFADDITVDPHPFISSATRAEVQAQLQQHKAAGVNPWSTSYNPLAQFRGQKTRAQVTAEYIAARDVVDAFTGEDSGSGFLSGRPAGAGEPRLAGTPVTAH